MSSDDYGIDYTPPSPRIFWRLFNIAYFVLFLLGLGLHLLTIAIANSTWGFLAAGATVCFPVVSQIFWFIVVWYYQGTPFSFYGIAVIGYAALCGILLTAGQLMKGKLDEDAPWCR